MLRRGLVIAALVCAGCGPIEYVSQVTVQAQHVVNRARDARAEELAPYEYTVAVESLHKSRELAGQARWEDALRFGQDALKYGRDAETRARAVAARPEEKHD